MDSKQGATPEQDLRARAVVIPGTIARFLERANAAFAGTRTQDLVPLGHRVSGWRIGADARTLTVLVSEPLTAGLIESLQDNGAFALTVEDFPAHETYQFKGQYVRHRPVEPEDVALVDRIRNRFIKSMKTLDPVAPDSIMGTFISKPGLAVEFEVFEIYLQTPGPGAGTRLVPPPEA